MLTNEKIIATAVKLARLAASTSSDAERETASAKLAAYCSANGLSVADIIARATQADTGETPLNREARAKRAEAAEAARNAKRQAEADKRKAEAEAASAAKAAKPSKPADESKAERYAERIALIGELRGIVATRYNGPSLAVRTNPKRYASSVYSDLFATPKHRTTLDRVSTRDESALALIIERGSKAGAFDPVALNLDSGIFSRLCSIGFIASDADGFRLSDTGLAHARKAFRKAA